MPTLTWLTREYDLKTSRNAPYRLLEEVPELSYSNPSQPSDNMLIHGDNLDALKALLPYYAGQVKCIYIDPPYNTRSAFEHYDDNLEHSQWLAMIYPRLELLRELLAEDGSIWVTIDDNEGHYLKVVMDEVFGRKNFISTVVWENFYGRSGTAAISPAHNYIHCYSPLSGNWKHVRGLLPRSEQSTSKYKNPDNDPRGSWRLGPIFAAEERHEGLMYTITTPSGRKIAPPKGSHWRIVEPVFWEMYKDNRISFGASGNNVPAVKLFLNEVQDGVVPRSLWPHTEAGHTQDGKREIMSLFPGETPFGTPKPEKLLQNVIQIATKPGDLVLDSFLGSGTTAAVAHKMGRRYIGIEMGEHAVTHCVPRLQKVIDGEQGGISTAVGWQGGGGFRFYRLGEAIFDEEGRINKSIRFATLAAHVWFSETKVPWSQPHPHPNPPLEGEGTLVPSAPEILAPPPSRGRLGGGWGETPFLGIHNNTAYYLLYNGILGDKRPEGGNVLTSKVLALLTPHDGPKVIYGETSRFSAERLKLEGITFKQTPYDIKAR